MKIKEEDYLINQNRTIAKVMKIEGEKVKLRNVSMTKRWKFINTEKVLRAVWAQRKVL